MDTDAIAEIIEAKLNAASITNRYVLVDEFIEAIADHFTTTGSFTGAWLDGESREWIVSHVSFDREAFIRKCKGL